METALGAGFAFIFEGVASFVTEEFAFIFTQAEEEGIVALEAFCVVFTDCTI